MDALGHERFAVVGHDTGFAIGYALAADHPERVDRVALAEIPGPPGVGPSPPLFVPAQLNDKLWHIPFNRVEKLPEQLIEGREDVFFGYEFAIQGGNAARRGDRLLRRNTLRPGCPHGSLGFYRAFDTTVAQNQRAYKTAAHDARSGDWRRAKLRRTRRRRDERVAGDVQGVVIPGAGHWVAEEAPDELLRR